MLSLTEEITVDETLSTGKEVTLRDSVYQRFVQKGPGTSFRDLAPRLLNDINAPMDVTQIGISHFDDNVFWSLYLEDEVGQEDGLAEALVGIGGGNTANIERDINRQNRDRRPSFNNNVLDEVNGDGGDIVGFLYRVLDINDVDNPYQLYAVVDESRAGVDFADWVDKNNISRIVLQGTQGTITIQGGEIDTEPQGSFGLGNKYKIYQLSDRTDFGQFIGGVGPNNFYKIYKGRTEIDTDEGNVIPRGTYYFQTYENTSENNKVPLEGKDVADNFDISDETNQSSVRLRASTMIPLGNQNGTDGYLQEGNRFEKSAQTPLAWIESDRDKLINLLYIRTQTITSTLENLLKASIYKYVCRFKWVDSLGNEHRSQWSSPVQLITGPREGSKNRVIVGRLREKRAEGDDAYNQKTAAIDNHENWDTVIVGEISTLARIGSEVLRIAPVEIKCNLLNLSKKKNIAIEVYRTWDLQDTYRQVKLEPSQNDLKDNEGPVLRDGELLNGENVSRGVFDDASDGSDVKDVPIRDTLRDNQLGQIIHPNNIVVNGAEEVEVFKERFVIYGFPAFRNKIFVSSPIDPYKELWCSIFRVK